MFNPSIMRPPHRSPSQPFAQLYSIDCYQRIPVKKLSHLPWEHLCSGIESRGLVTKKMGYTEWQAALDDCLLSLSWDWRQLHDGAITPDFSSGLRTNMLCIDASGYDLPTHRSETLLSEFIEQLDWVHFVVGSH